MAGRKLALTVWVDGERYLKGTVPPTDVAKQIGSDHPHAWEKAEDSEEEAGARSTRSTRSTGGAKTGAEGGTKDGAKTGAEGGTKDGVEGQGDGDKPKK